MAFYFQRSEDYLADKWRKREPVPIVCPFCESNLGAMGVDQEEDFNDHSHHWSFVSKCENCGIHLTFSVNYHETIVQPIGGQPTRIFPK